MSTLTQRINRPDLAPKTQHPKLHTPQPLILTFSQLRAHQSRIDWTPNAGSVYAL